LINAAHQLTHALAMRDEAEGDEDPAEDEDAAPTI
jgi:hypothetical protein